MLKFHFSGSGKTKLELRIFKPIYSRPASLRSGPRRPTSTTAIHWTNFNKESRCGCVPYHPRPRGRHGLPPNSLNNHSGGRTPSLLQDSDLIPGDLAFFRHDARKLTRGERRILRLSFFFSLLGCVNGSMEALGRFLPGPGPRGAPGQRLPTCLRRPLPTPQSIAGSEVGVRSTYIPSLMPSLNLAVDSDHLCLPS